MTDIDAQNLGLIDSHAHIELNPLVQDPHGVMERAAAAGICAIITVGINLDDAKNALLIAEHFDNVFVSVGFHPHNAKEVGETGLKEMAKLAQNPKVFAYGEVGLDFYWRHSPPEVQEKVFHDQLDLAKELEKPVVIHLRDAYKKGLNILEKHGPYPKGGVIHCFSGNREDAQRALDLGFYLSFPGVLTFKRSVLLQQIASELPEDRILLETDCPFLAPVPLRGRTNEPAYMIHTARKMAELRNTSLEDVARFTRENTIRLFGLPLSQPDGSD